MGKPLYGEKLESAVLGKPFTPIKVVEAIVYDEAGNFSHKGKVRLYMDPRGDIEFAVGVHPWMAKMLEATGDRYKDEHYNTFGIMSDSAGHYYVLGETAKKALERFRQLQHQYTERLEAIDGEKYLAITFNCKAPKFDSRGNEVEKDDGIDVGDTPRRIDDSVSIQMSDYEGVLAPDERGVKQFYSENEEGRLRKVYMGGGDTQVIYLIDTPENRAAVKAIRMTLANAVDMLHGLFARSPEAFVQQLRGISSSLLPAPQQELKSIAKPSVKRRTR